jgi:hypothetical protein
VVAGWNPRNDSKGRLRCHPGFGVAFGLGLWGDAHHWWDDRSFLTNLLSSFTGLLVGVPFALVVLSHLGAMQLMRPTGELPFGVAERGGSTVPVDCRTRVRQATG